MEAIAKLITDNPKLLESIPATAKNALENLLVSQASPVISPPVVSEVDPISSTIFNSRVFITVFLLLWAVFLIVMTVITSDKERRDTYRNIHEIIFGNIGVLTIILILWIGFAIVSVLPTLANNVPRLIDTIGSVGTNLATSLLK